jgi:hypothetical protein
LHEATPPALKRGPCNTPFAVLKWLLFHHGAAGKIGRIAV